MGPYSTDTMLGRIQAGHIKITRENVLRVRDTMYDDARRLTAVWNMNVRRGLDVPTLGRDPVSGDAAGAFNVRLSGLVAWTQAYINDLFATVEALTETARGYGIAEDEIRDRMHGLEQGEAQPRPPLKADDSAPGVDAYEAGAGSD